ncbi:MAG: hypothetical protein ACO26L_04940 [Candidatus Fonsibacter ubiquis]
MITLSKSTRKGKKWQVKFPDGKTVHFGAEGYLDYTQHKDPKRKELYIQRHAKREDWNNLNTAGSWAYNLLWSYPSLQEAIRKMEMKFNIKIKKL